MKQCGLGIIRQFSNVANEIRKGLTTSKFIRPEMTIACMEIMDECRKKMNFLYPSEIINNHKT